MPPPNTPRQGSVDLAASPFAPPNTPAHAINNTVALRTPIEASMTQDEDAMEFGSATTQTDEDLYGINVRTLNFVKPVDENLICPICRSPFFRPVDMICGHTFCTKCIWEALQINQACPIGRYFLSRNSAYRPSSRLINNLCDALEVECPCCKEPFQRSLIEDHVYRYCSKAPVECKVDGCELPIMRERFDEGCLHYDSICPDCEGVVQQALMPHHRETLCEKREIKCVSCDKDILKIQEKEHLEVCGDADVCCKYVAYGCLHTGKRKDMQSHLNGSCALRFTGPNFKAMENDLDFLRGDVTFLKEKDVIQTRRVKFLENKIKERFQSATLNDNPFMNAIRSLPVEPTANPFSTEDHHSASRHTHLLSFVEALAEKLEQLEQLAKGLTDLESRQTVMLLNETLPLKEQITEIRNAQNTVSMQVRWLLNLRLREVQHRNGSSGSAGGRGGNGGGPSGSNGSGGDNDSADSGGSGGNDPVSSQQQLGEMGDSMREVTTKL